jgi:CheY-like chemotaxis protein
MTTKQAKKILMIEDDPDQQMMYSLEFSNFGYKLELASKGEEGVAKAKEINPDLIFLDLILGDMEGLEVLKQIKADQKTKNIKVIVMTNLTKKGLEEECRKLGAFDYVIKSKFIPKEIVEKAKNYLK